MKLDIRRPLLPVDPTLHQFVTRRLRYALSRFHDQIEEVTVQLSHEDGLQGENVKTCHVVARISTRSVAVRDAHPDLYVAVSRAAERMGRAVSRELARSRMLRPVASATSTVPRKGKFPRPNLEEES